MGFLTSLFRAATPENPRFSLSDPEAVNSFLDGDGSKSSSGINVSDKKAMTYSPWFRGVNMLSNDVAKLPVTIRQLTADGKGSEPAPMHQAFTLVRRKPNPWQTAREFIKLLTGWACTKGNGYALIQHAGGTPVTLIPMDPDTVTPQLVGGVLSYLVLVNGQQKRLNKDDVFHIKGMSSDGISGLSVVQLAAESLGLGMAGRKYGSVFFRNNARPSVILEHPLKLAADAAKRLKSDFEGMHAGLDNAHRTAILDQGMKANVLSFSATDSQLLELMQFTWRDVANFLNLPPHKVGDISRGSFASLESENESYLENSIDPWCGAWESEIWDKLLTEEEKTGDTHFAYFDRKSLQKADMASRANYYRVALGGRPWMNQNEVREEEGLNPDDDPKADQILDPLNMGGPANSPNNPADSGPGRPPAAMAEMVAETTRRMVRRISVHAIRAAEKGGKVYGAWLDAFRGDHEQVVRDACGPIEGLGAWILAACFREFSSVIDTATAKTLGGDVERKARQLESALPAKAVADFLEPEPLLLPPPPVQDDRALNEVRDGLRQLTAAINAPKPVVAAKPKIIRKNSNGTFTVEEA